MTLAMLLVALGSPTGSLRPVGESFRDRPDRVVSSELADAMVYVSDPSLLATKVPRVLEATWRPTSGEGRKLERTPEQTRAVAAQGKAMLRATFAKGLETYADLRRASYDASLAPRLINGLGNAMIVGDQWFGPSGPADVLLQHLLAELAPRLESELPYRTPSVYASAPTAAEHPFGPMAAARIAAYPAVEREVARRYAEGKSVRLERWTADRLAPPGTRPGEEDPGVGRVTVRFYFDERAITSRLETYRPDGSSRTWVGWDCLPVWNEVRPFHFARETDALTIPENRPSLAAPGNEPLDVTVTPALDALRDRLGLPIVTAVPDTVAVTFAKAPPKNLGQVVRGFEEAGIEFAVEDGTLVGHPVDLVRFAHQNLARPALRRWTTTMHVPGTDWLRAWALLYAGSPYVTPLASYLRETVFPKEGIATTQIGYSGWTYRLLGRLSDTEWAALLAGRPVAIGTDAVRREMAFAMSNRLDRTEVGGRLPDAALAGSLSFPYGIPATATLTMESGEGIVFRTPRFQEWYDVVVLTDNAFAVENPPSEATVESFELDLARAEKGDGRIEFGRRGSRILTLWPDGRSGLMKRQDQAEVEVRSEGPPGPFRSASEEIRKSVLTEINANLETRRKEAGGAPP